jgi:hypothetical protein
MIIDGRAYFKGVEPSTGQGFLDIPVIPTHTEFR